MTEPLDELRLKGLQWEVSLLNRPEVYYRGRGGTPKDALASLVQSMETGIAESEEQLTAQRKKRDKLIEALREAQS